MTLARQQARRGTAAAWTSANPTLAAGEFGWESDTNKLKIGDGSTAWNALPYIGGGGAAAFVGAAAARTSAQSITHATWTAIQYNATDVYDTDSIHDPASNNTRLTVPTGKGGVWRFTGTVEFAANTTGVRAIAWAKNGTQLADRFGAVYRSPSPSYATVMTSTVDLLLAAGDYVAFHVYHERGSALDASTSYASCQFLG